MRNPCQDDPEKDWEYTNKDYRPIIGYCEYCKEPIYGESITEYADDAWDFGDADNYFICEYCLQDYLKDKKIKGGQ